MEIPDGKPAPDQEREQDHSFSFAQLDPRPGQNNPDYQFGIEVTDPKLIKDGVPNIDHHGPNSTVETPSACEQALDCPLPSKDSTLATVRVDKDSLTAMAVLASRRQGRPIDKELVQAVGAIDRFGPRAIEKYEQYRPLIIALDRQAANFKLSLEERVRFAQAVLDGTVDMAQVQEMVAQRDREFAEAKAHSTVQEVVPGKLAYVESTHRFATNLGYEVAATIVARNPAMAAMVRGEDGAMKPSGETYDKYTIARYDNHVPTDITAIVRDLQEAEAKARGIPVEQLKNMWGGRGDIIGSPQNESTKLTPEQVLDIVKKHLTDADKGTPPEQEKDPSAAPIRLSIQDVEHILKNYLFRTINRTTDFEPAEGYGKEMELIGRVYREYARQRVSQFEAASPQAETLESPKTMYTRARTVQTNETKWRDVVESPITEREFFSRIVDGTIPTDELQKWINFTVQAGDVEAWIKATQSYYDELDAYHDIYDPSMKLYGEYEGIKKRRALEAKVKPSTQPPK